MEKITYEWVKSGRRTLAIQIRADGCVVVRTPYSVSRTQVEKFLEERRDCQEPDKAERSAGAEDRNYRGSAQGGRGESEGDIPAACGILCPYDGSFLRQDYDSGAEDTMGELQRQGKPEF